MIAISNLNHKCAIENEIFDNIQCDADWIMVIHITSQCSSVSKNDVYVFEYRETHLFIMVEVWPKVSKYLNFNLGISLCYI